MSVGTLLVYAYLVGATSAGCVGSFIEWRSGRGLSLRAPFVTPNHIGRSLSLVLFAGPYLLLSELKAARARRAISVSFAIIGLAFSTGWALASGILLVEFMGLCSRLL